MVDPRGWLSVIRGNPANAAAGLASSRRSRLAQPRTRLKRINPGTIHAYASWSEGAA
jgi:hypothetical protein